MYKGAGKKLGPRQKSNEYDLAGSLGDLLSIVYVKRFAE